MKFKDCIIGTPVRVTSTVNYSFAENIGHIIGFTYCYNILIMGTLPHEKWEECIIPLIRFPSGNEIGINHNNIERL